jgi:hypothetical protein
MVTRQKTLPIPEPIVQLQRQLDQFRRTQSQRTKLPESLWQAAVEFKYRGREISPADILYIRALIDRPPDQKPPQAIDDAV